MILRTLGGGRRAVGVLVAIALFSAVDITTVNAQSRTKQQLGSIANGALNRPIVGMAATRTGKGYWLAAADGGVFTFGDAQYRGSTGNLRLAAPIVGIAATPSGNGYWLAAADGGVFTFGDARYRGSTGGRRLAAPIVGIAATPSGNGYWLAAADGGVFTFGDAQYRGSTGHRAPATPIVGIARTRSGAGYWLAASNGQVFAFGDASFERSARRDGSRIVGISAVAYGARDGYWLAAADGRAHPNGYAGKYATRFAAGAAKVASRGNRVVTIAASPTGGYWVVSRRGTVGASASKRPVNIAPAARAAVPTASRSLKLKPRIGLQLLARMNAERKARNMKPFRWDPVLAKRATIWAKTLLTTGRFEHQDFGLIANAAPGRFSELGENLFSGTGSAADAGTAHLVLMRSHSHRANILLRQGQVVGIAALCLRGKLMVVQDFGIRMGAPLPSARQGIPSTNPIVASNEGGAGCAQA